MILARQKVVKRVKVCMEMSSSRESVDSSFNLDSSVKSDDDFVSESFCENWVLQLSRDDKVSLALFLTFQLSKYFDCGTTRAACRTSWHHGN